jgi:hypothetical protein
MKKSASEISRSATPAIENGISGSTSKDKLLQAAEQFFSVKEFSA